MALFNLTTAAVMLITLAAAAAAKLAVTSPISSSSISVGLSEQLAAAVSWLWFFCFRETKIKNTFC